MFGMGVATTVGYMASLAVTCTHFLKSSSTYRLVRAHEMRNTLAEMVLIGFPTSLNRICTSARSAVLNNLLVALGGVGAVTAFSVRSSMLNLTSSLTAGMAQAILPVAGLFYGSADREALRVALKETLLIGMLLNTAAAIMVCIFPTALTTLFGVTQPPETVAMSVRALVSLAVSMPFMTVNLMFLNFYQSTRNTSMANVICVGESLVFVLLFSFVLSPVMGVSAVWLAFVLGEAAMLIVLWAVIAVKCGHLPRVYAMKHGCPRPTPATWHCA